MVIRPSQNDPSRRIPTPGTEATPAAPALQRDPARPDATAAAPNPVDRAEVSDAAQELFESQAAPPDAGQLLAPERMRAVLGRLRDGHYDQPQILDHVAKQIRAEAEGPPKDV